MEGPTSEDISMMLNTRQEATREGGRVMEFSINPPAEVRTSTRNEVRCFTVEVTVDKSALIYQTEILEISLSGVFADDISETVPVLEGNLSKSFAASDFVSNQDLRLQFSGLSVSMASLKLLEREFKVKAVLKTNSDICEVAFSTAFYSFSHKNVLKRRKNIEAVLVSPEVIALKASTRMHIVGQPFLKGPNLSVYFAISNSDTFSENWIFVKAKNLQLYSDSVLFFDPPSKEDLDEKNLLSVQKEIEAFVMVSNDGRSFSKSLGFRIKLVEPDSIFDETSESFPELNLDVLNLSLPNDSFSVGSMDVDFDDFNLVPQKRPKMYSRM